MSAATKTEDVSPAWLLKALGITLAAALVCGYLTACLLFYQGQWQLVLHPSRSASMPSDIAGIPFETIHFGVDESATPQLAGWYLPAAPNAAHDIRYSAYTLLYLPGGDGSLADALPTLAALHNLGLNLFAFDYRGYGQSAATHPNQQRMSQDAASAWEYLTVSRTVPSARIILFGSGIGAALAAQLAQQHPDVPAVLLDSPRPDLLQTVLSDPRTEFLPVRVLFHDRFDIAARVGSLKTPKLFVLPEAPPSGGPPSALLSSLAENAAAPKTTVHLQASDRSGPVFSEQISRFFDEYLR